MHWRRNTCSRLRKPGRYPIKLNLRTYRVLRIVARSSEGALARDVHAALARQYGDEVSRQFVTNMLALLIRKGLVKRVSEGPNPTYHATSIGRILAAPTYQEETPSATLKS